MNKAWKVGKMALITLLMLLSSCFMQNQDAGEACEPLSIEEYKEKYDWIDTVYSPYVISAYDRLRIRNKSYGELVDINGTPCLEYRDTIVRGINLQRGVEDFDLYPMTLNRDTVIVSRCWWLKRYRITTLLYVVFEHRKGEEDSYPIYGYLYRPGDMPRKYRYLNGGK
ncbi:hypothetical protein [uncultured Muribaculum sp.]|nr:hypothetical protein [uncultured Muribaculum sp.]